MLAADTNVCGAAKSMLRAQGEEPVFNLQLRSKLARRTTLLALAGIPTSVAALPVATVTTVATATSAKSSPLAAFLAHHATRRGMRPLLLDVGGRYDLGREVEPLAEVVETLRGEGVVVVLPRELSLDIAARRQRLEGLDHEKVADAGLVGRLIATGLENVSNRSRRGEVGNLIKDVRAGCRLRTPRVGDFWNSENLLLRSDHHTLPEEILQHMLATAFHLFPCIFRAGVFSFTGSIKEVPRIGTGATDSAAAYLMDRLAISLGNKHLGGLSGVDTTEGVDLVKCRLLEGGSSKFEI